MAYKVFSNGSVLNASEINDNLMNQSVMVFSNAAARTAAITSPVEGMLTYLEDTDNYQKWTGSLWAMADDVALIAKVDFTSTTSVIISNCFSSLYDNYFVQLDKASGGVGTRFQLRTGSTTLASGYAGNVIYGTGASALSTTRATTYWESFAGAADATSAYIYYPFMTRAKIWHAISNQGTLPGLDAGNQSSTTSYESLVVSFPNSTTGTVRIYGLRK